MKKRVLIVGGAGYIGGYLTDLLVANTKKFEPTVYDSLLYEHRYLKNVNFISGDIRDFNKLKSIINEYDIVIWLAALVGDPACKINPTITYEVNTNTVKWLVDNYSGKIVFLSTCSVYGINNDILNENSPVSPLSEYANSKYEAEQYIVKNYDDYLIFRLGTLFGVSDEHSRIRLDLVVNALTKRAVNNEVLNVFGGDQWRPLLHVKDVGEAILFGINRDITGLYNLSYKNYRICDIAQEIQKIIPEAKVQLHDIQFEDLRNYQVTSNKFIDLGWKPMYNLKQGIRQIYDVLKTNRIKNPEDNIYINGKYLGDGNLK